MKAYNYLILCILPIVQLNTSDQNLTMKSTGLSIELLPEVQPRGGFLVSACKNSTGVYYIEIEPRRDNQCRLMNPWPGKTVAVHEVGKTDPVLYTLDKSNGECIIFTTVANHKYLIESK